MKNLLLFIAVSSALIACSDKTTVVATTESTVDEPVKAEMTLAATEGKNLYEAKCQKCHKLKNIDNFTSEQWNKILPNMAGKAKLQSEETMKVDSYIQWELQN